MQIIASEWLFSNFSAISLWENYFSMRFLVWPNWDSNHRSKALDGSS